MITALEALSGRFWVEMAAHLWQTCLVWGVLGLAALALRKAPGGIVHWMWRLALVKLLVPVGLLGGLLRGALPEGWSALVGGMPASISHTLLWMGVALDPLVVRPAGAESSPLMAAAILGATGLWLTGSILLLLGILRHARADASLRRRSVPLSAAAIAIASPLDEACAATGTPPDCLRLVDEGLAPVTSGSIRPWILVPVALVERLSPAELRGVLLHEEAHRRRRDPAWNALQRFALALFFFFPPLHLVIRRLRETAEFACDEAALAAGTSPSIYATALARTVDLGLSQPVLSSAASGGGRTLLRRRFHRLKTLGRNRTMRRYRWIAGGAMAVALVLTLLPLALHTGSITPAEAGPVGTETGAAEFDTPPVPVNAVPPKYPDVCRKEGVSGPVHVEVVVTVAGAVTHARVIKNVDECPALGKAALDAANQWTFEPARKDGKPVAAKLVIPFSFKLH